MDLVRPLSSRPTALLRSAYGRMRERSPGSAPLLAAAGSVRYPGSALVLGAVPNQAKLGMLGSA